MAGEQGEFSHQPYEISLTAVNGQIFQEQPLFCLGNPSLCVFRQEEVAGDIQFVQVGRNEALDGWGACFPLTGNGSQQGMFRLYPIAFGHWPGDAPLWPTGCLAQQASSWNSYKRTLGSRGPFTGNVPRGHRHH